MVMLNSKTYAPSSYVGSPRFTRMEKTARTTFSDGEKYPTTKEVRLLLTLCLVSVVVTGSQIVDSALFRSENPEEDFRNVLEKQLSVDNLVYHGSLVAFHRNQLDRRVDDMPLNDTALYHLINIRVHDMDAVDKPWDASTRSMRYAACLGDRLWTMVTREQNRVCVFCFFVLLRN